MELLDTDGLTKIDDARIASLKREKWEKIRPLQWRIGWLKQISKSLSAVVYEWEQYTESSKEDTDYEAIPDVISKIADIQKDIRKYRNILDDYLIDLN